MTQSRKRSLWSLSIWSAEVAVFVPLFFLVDAGAAGFATDSVRIAATAVLVATGWTSHFIMMARTRVRPGRVECDERDELIESRSNGAALLAVMVYVYAVAILLWVAFQDSGCVPAGWMWFLAYTTIFCAYISHAVSALALHARMGADA